MKLTAAQRKALPLSDYAVPSKAPGPGSYPVPDPAHAQLAKALAARFASPATQKAVAGKAKVVLKRKKRKAPQNFTGTPGMAAPGPVARRASAQQTRYSH